MVLLIFTLLCMWAQSHACFCHPEPGPAIEGVFGKDWCMDLWREEKLPPQRKMPMEAAPMTSMGPQVSDSFMVKLMYLNDLNPRVLQ